MKLQFTKSQLKTLKQMNEFKNKHINFTMDEIETIEMVRGGSEIEVTLKNGEYFQVTKRGMVKFETLETIVL